jgi:ferritin
MAGTGAALQTAHCVVTKINRMPASARIAMDNGQVNFFSSWIKNQLEEAIA